jgi:YHS domain-containing protein
MNHLDPVCGKVLRPSEAVASAPYEANLYHFCSQECHGRFWTNPGLYVNGGSIDGDHSHPSSPVLRAPALPWHRTG